MNEVPPGQGDDEADDLYRRASALDDSRPSELVRRRVLNHAAQLAKDRAAQNSGPRTPARVAHRRWRQPAIAGTLAAAALAGLLIAPRFLTPSMPPTASSSAPTGALPSEPTSVSDAPGAPSAAGAPSVTSLPGAPGAPRAPVVPSAPPMAALPRAADVHESRALAKSAAREGPSRMQNSAAARYEAANDATQAGALPGPAADAAAQLRHAAEVGDVAELQMLLGERPPIDARDDAGRTALMLAALHGQPRAVDVLLAHGADPNAADLRGTTPLQAAIGSHEPAIAAALRRAGAR